MAENLHHLKKIPVPRLFAVIENGENGKRILGTTLVCEFCDTDEDAPLEILFEYHCPV